MISSIKFNNFKGVFSDIVFKNLIFDKLLFVWL